MIYFKGETRKKDNSSKTTLSKSPTPGRSKVENLPIFDLPLSQLHCVTQECWVVYRHIYVGMLSQLSYAMGNNDQCK